MTLFAFRNPFPDASTVSIVGDFTDWLPISLIDVIYKKLSDGIHPYWYIVNDTVRVRPNSLTMTNPIRAHRLNYIVIKYGIVDKLFLQKSINVGDIDAMIRLGDYYFNKWRHYVYSVDPDYAYENHTQKLLHYYLSAVNLGNAYAARQLGRFYNYLSQYTWISDEFCINACNKCEFYLKIAADRGDSEAMNKLGTFYHNIGNYAERTKYWAMAISNGNTRAMINFGNIRQSEIDGDHDMSLYYNMAIVRGNTKGYIKFALYYLLKNNEDMFKMNIDKAIKMGDSNGYLILGHYYESRGKTKMAVKYYLLAAENNNIKAFDILCRYYSSKDVNKSREYCKKYSLLSAQRKRLLVI